MMDFIFEQERWFEPYSLYKAFVITALIGLMQREDNVVDEAGMSTATTRRSLEHSHR